jgi:hypothetical protein
VESDGVFFQEQFKNVSAYDQHFKNEVLKDLPYIKSIDNDDIIFNQIKI